MRILLVGEFSGFFTALKRGLVELGHEVRTFSGGDSWKGFSADWPLYSKRAGLSGKLDRHVLLPAAGLARALAFQPDVVQFVNPLIIAPPRGLIPINRAFILALVASARRSYLSCAGDDAMYWRAVDALRYSPKQDQLAIDFGGTPPKDVGAEALSWNQELARRVTGIIPISYEYAIGYRQFKNIKKTIPLPFSTFSSPPVANDFSGKIKVYHGITRRGFKGTQYILEAFRDLEKTHSQYFEFVTETALPYQQYLKKLDGVHVLVDQTNSYCYGMNAILGLASGKLVLSGAEPEALRELGVTDCPIVNVTPSAGSVRAALLGVVANRSAMARRAERGPMFVHRFHDAVTIARRYISVWTE